MKPKNSKADSIFFNDVMIEAQAAYDLEKYASAVGSLKFPIYPEELIETLWDVVIEPREVVKDNKGKIVLACYSPTDRKVYVSVAAAGENDGRASFTVAHEAGHISLHDFLASGVENGICIGSPESSEETVTNTKEKQAEKYASALLMPEQEVKDQIQKILNKEDVTVLDLSEHSDSLRRHFNVSFQALEIRLDRLGIAIKNSYYQKRAKPLDTRIFDKMEDERANWTFNE